MNKQELIEALEELKESATGRLLCQWMRWKDEKI